MSAATMPADAANQQILQAADELFYPHGVSAVTMSDIRDASGVSLRRLYSLYPSKSDLVAGWLVFRHDQWTEWFETAIAKSIATGVAAHDAMFDALATWLVATEFRGCGFINTLTEVHDLTPQHRQVIQDHKTQLVTLLAQHTADAPALAVLVDGAIVQSAIFQTLEPVTAARRAAAVVLDNAHTTIPECENQ